MTTAKLMLLSLFLMCHTMVKSQDDTQGTDLLNEAVNLKNRLKDPFQYGGSIQTDFRFNAIQGLPRRLDPFDFRMNGNLYGSLLGLRTQISFRLSDGKIIRRLDSPNVKLPSYFFLGLSPSYKWLKLHLGYRNMDFSPYSFSGISFTGLGIEMKPKKFRLSSFYGTLQRSRPENMDLPNSLDPAFSRVGWGIKTGYEDGEDKIFVIVFSAKDDPTSINRPILRNEITPAENLISSITGQKKLANRFSISWDYALSALTRDQAAPILQNNPLPWYLNYGTLLRTRASTGYHKALKTSLMLDILEAKVDLSHERVDPGYQSLGALFFANDFERFSLGASRTFLNKRLQIQARTGFQRNNLSGTESNVFQRWVGQLNTNFRINEQWNVQAGFNNFSSTNVLRISRLPNPELDSLILSQVNQSGQFSIQHFRGKNKQSIFIFMLNYQQFNAIRNEQIDFSQSSDNLIFNVQHMFRFPSKSILTNGILYIQNDNATMDINNFGTVHSYTRTWFENKLKTSASANNLFLMQGNQLSRHILQLQITGNYKITNNLSLGLSSGWIRQQSFNNAALPTFNEWNTKILARMSL